MRILPNGPGQPIPPAAGSALASSASPLRPDAALFAMQSAIEAADRELDDALDALEAAQEAYSDKEPAGPAEPSGPGFSAEEQRALDAFAAKLRAGRERGRPPEGGVTAAHEMEDAVHETISQVRADLVDTPAKTLAGLIYKARYAATHYRTEYVEDVMASIVDDLLAMADDPEGFAEA